MQYDDSLTVRSHLKTLGIAAMLAMPGVTEFAINRPYEGWTETHDGWQRHDLPNASLEMLNQFAPALAIYNKAAAHAESRGLILADTKFEFGRVDGRIILADEVLTPDSSRFWDASLWKPGGPQPSFDKQFVRDYLEAINWNKQAPAPSLPDDVVARTQAKYLEAFHRLTGRDLKI